LPAETGAAATFDEIVAVHQPRVAHLVDRLLGVPEDVDDVVQEVFLAVLRNLDRFRGQCRFSTWLTTIALNKCRSHRRGRLLRLRTWRRLAATMRDRSRGDPRAADMEAHEQVRRAVARLPAKYRETIVLRYFEQLDIAEVAEILRVSRGAVEVRLSRARHRLKEVLSATVQTQPRPT
jgi:RNA polymerase sigma-70 factor (ECF subfamily)